MGTLYTGTRKVTYHLDLEATIDGTPASGRFSFSLPEFDTNAHATDYFQIYVGRLIKRMISDFPGTLDNGYYYVVTVEVDEDIHIENTFAESPNNLVDTLGRPTDWTHLPVGDLN